MVRCLTDPRALLRQELPRLVYANPTLTIDMEPSDQANMPSRTIVWGDKSATEIVQELLTMARFAGNEP